MRLSANRCMEKAVAVFCGFSIAPQTDYTHCSARDNPSGTPRIGVGDSHAALSSRSAVPRQGDPVAFVRGGGETNPLTAPIPRFRITSLLITPCSSKRRPRLTVILYDATQSPKHRWESVFLSSQPDKYLSSTPTTP